MKKISIAIIATLLVAIAGVFALWLRGPDPSSLERPESAADPTQDPNMLPSAEGRLLGQISKIVLSKGKIVMGIEILENVEGQKNMEDAAVADGVCTREQTDRHECLSDPFYIRKTGKFLQLEVDPDAKVWMYAREPRGGMLPNENGSIYMQQIPLEQFIRLYGVAETPSYLRDIPFYLGINAGKVTWIKEKYLP